MILVIGGTGLVGRTVVRLLRADGRPVRILSRSPDRLELEGVERVPGDVRDVEGLQSAMVGAEAIVYAVAVLRERRRETYASINVQGVRNAIQAAQAAGVGRFLYVSVLGTVDDRRYRYIHSRWVGEEAILESGLAFTVFKPSMLFGESFGILDRLVKAIRFTPPPLVLLPDGGRARFQPLWVEDLATCILASLREERTVGQSYELGGPDYWSFAQMMDLVLRLRGARRIQVPIPRSLLVPSVIAMGLLFRDPPVTLAELKQLAVDHITDLDSVSRQFGFEPEPLERHMDYVKAL